MRLLAFALELSLTAAFFAALWWGAVFMAACLTPAV